MSKVFEDLNWRVAFKRAAVLIALYLALTYVLSTAFPGSFGVSLSELPFFAVNAVFFFFIFAAVYAFSERAKRRRMARMKDEEKSKDSGSGDENGQKEGSLKGQLNPNTSRKKAARKRKR